MSKPIRLGFIGAGTIAQTGYAVELNLPHLRDRFEVIAIQSRTMDSAAKLASLLPSSPQLITDEAALLARADLEAVVVAVPILALPGAVERTLAAGKHVISEKPISPTLEVGRRLVEKWKLHHRDRVWMVAENWRYEEAFLTAAQILEHKQIGNPVMADWTRYSPMLPGNIYYDNGWRRQGDFPGGFILDGGVHQVAAMRLILGEVLSVTAATARCRHDLPPADTIVSTLNFSGGTIATYARSYAVDAPWNDGLRIACERGSLTVDRGKIEMTNAKDGETRTIVTKSNNGGPDQLLAFADAVRRGSRHRNMPEEALRDIAVIEAMLLASSRGRAVRPEY